MTLTPLTDHDDTVELSSRHASRRGPRRRGIVVAVVATVAVGLLGVVVARSLFGTVTPHLYSGTVLQQSEPAPSMDGLRFVSGEPVDVAAFADELVLVYFGYTNCPDICPTTLSSAATAIDQLSSDQQDKVRLLMVTVDPERDLPAELEEYVEFFHPEFDGATGDLDAVTRVASLYGVFYEHGEGSIEEGYVVDHTATLMAIGPDGALRIVWPPEVSSKDLRDDIKELL